MKKVDLIKTIRLLLIDDNNLVSYLSSRVIINLISDGKGNKQNLNVIENEICRAMKNWKPLSFDYISYENIFKLLKSSRQCAQKWACWTLINLNSKNFNGQLVVKNLINNQNVKNSIKILLREFYSG